jgi:hypothetical protein
MGYIEKTYIPDDPESDNVIVRNAEKGIFITFERSEFCQGFALLSPTEARELSQLIFNIANEWEDENT